jgi:hypothetical protein
MNRLAFMTCVLFATVLIAQTTQPVIHLATDVEDGKKMVHAVVTVSGKPKENIVLQYFVKRMFGNLQIGEDTTLDDGTSAIPFPSNLPGSADGTLTVIAKVKGPPEVAGVTESSVFPADRQALAAGDPFPRALWSPNAPLPLMFCIFALLAGIWLSYLFVVSRVLLIRTGGKV